MEKRFLIMMICFLFLPAACDTKNAASLAMTYFEKQQLETEAMEKVGCLYQGKLYSRGALKYSMKAVTNAQGQSVMQDDPDGIPMICERRGIDNHRWVVASQYRNNPDE